MRAILANSAGCISTGPTVSHLVAPFRSCPNSNTARSSPIVVMSNGKES
jgi:hypothetical protein